MLCNRNICEKLEYSFAAATEEIISSNEEFIHYIRHLKCRVNNLVRKQIKKNVSKSQRMDNSNLNNSSEASHAGSREIIPSTKKDEKVQFDKTDDKRKHDKKSRSKTSPKKSPERPITPKDSRFKSHKPSQRSADIQDLSDSGLGTSRFEPNDTQLTLDHSTPLSSAEISVSDITDAILEPERISRIRRTPDTSPESPLSPRKRDTVGKFVDKASSVVTPADPISEIRSTWTQRSVAMANHVRSRFYERMHAFVAALIVGVLVWIALIYGAFLGATLCNYRRFSIFPGSSLHAKPPMVFY